MCGHSVYIAGTVWLLLSLVVFAPVSAQAGGFGEDEVRAAVETWVRHASADARPDTVVARMEPYQAGGETVAYIAHLQGGGFALCGASDLVLPVYFYSPQGIYDPADPNYRYILWEIAERQRLLQQAKSAADPRLEAYRMDLADRAAYWQMLIAGEPVNREAIQSGVLADPTLMVLPLTSQWGQGSPYNDQCPELTPGVDEHTDVGCVATAMAQVMYYWKWPATGTGSGSTTYYWRWRTTWDETPLARDPVIGPAWNTRLRWTSASGGRLQMNGYWDESLYESAKGIPGNSYPDRGAYLDALATLWGRLSRASAEHRADFSAAFYNWGIMQDRHTDPPDSGAAEAAEISYHVGIAVGMDYGVEGSGAYMSDVDDALEDHFRYDADATLQDRDIERMTQEIQWLRPVIFTGRDDSGGHAWVVYGYDKGTDPDRQFRMNFGWNGSGDGWYSCDHIILGPGGQPVLYEDQEQVIRIAPVSVVRFVGGSWFWGDGTPDDPYYNIETATAWAPDGATLIFKAGSYNTFSGSKLTINRHLILKGQGVTIGK